MKKSILTIALMAAFAAPAFASDFYVGGDIGAATNSNPLGGLTSTSSTSLSLRGGYQATENIAIETAYTNVGNIAQGAVTAKTNALSLNLVGKLPVGAGFSAYGKLGYASARTTATSGQASTRGDITYGIGAQYDLNRNVAFRAGFEQIKIGDNVNVVRSDENIYSLGAQYSF